MKIFYSILFLFSSAFAFSQDMKTYEGGWLGEIEEGSFTFTVTLKQVNGDKFSFVIKNKSDLRNLMADSQNLKSKDF